MPNSVPATKKKMLEQLGVESVEDLYRDLVPEELRFRGEMNLPEAIGSEHDLKEHVDRILLKNVSSNEYASFLGAGCYRHYVPAVCDEINSRAEFLTAYVGDTYSDHGKLQAIFEYCSLMAELLDLEVVNYPTYDGGQAVASSLRMAMRITDKRELIIPAIMNPDIKSQIYDYCCHLGTIYEVDNTNSGTIDIEDLKEKLSANTAAVFFENPSFLGSIEAKGKKISSLSHAAGALLVVYADPISLGILESPANYGADLVCGDIQSLGMHQQFGGGHAGYIASRHEPKYIEQYPNYLYGIAPTKIDGEFGWGRALNYRCSHGSREKANEYFGTGSGLWAITAAVYLSLLGPQGIREIGETILYRTKYAMQTLSKVKGLVVNKFGGYNFREFMVNFDQIGLKVQDVNKKLLEHGILGGYDLSVVFPLLGESALYCVTEATSTDDIDKLAVTLSEISGKK